MNEFTGKLAKKVIILVILFSSLITLITSTIQLYFEYRQDIERIHVRLSEIRSSYLASISESVWIADQKQLQILLDGILQLPDMQYVAVYVEDKLYSYSGLPAVKSKIEHSTNLTHLHLKEFISIGRLMVQASLRGAYQRLWNRVWIILISNAVKTFIVAIFLYYLFAHLVTRHIATIAQYTRKLTRGGLDIPLALARKQSSIESTDELDELISSINEMRNKMLDTFQELERTQKEIREHRDHLEDKVDERTKELESFSYSISHDLRAPLRTIDGYSHILLTDYVDQFDDTATHYLNRMRLASQRMGELIDDLLELSRVSRIDLNYKEVNINALAQQTINALKERDPDRKVQFIINAPDVKTVGDERLLRVVLENLLGNAWKYTGQEKNPTIEFGAKKENSRWIYYVKDNGVGFDMNYAEKIFGAFQRLHRSDEFPGTGIGLATVYRIVRRHGGDIWADAEINKGATFYFVLGRPV